MSQHNVNLTGDCEAIVSSVADTFVADQEGVLAPKMGAAGFHVAMNPCMPTISLEGTGSTILTPWEAEQLALVLLGATRAWHRMDDINRRHAMGGEE